MVELIFGIIWTGFTSFIFGMCVFIPADVRNGVEMSLPLYIFFILFELVGVYLIYKGAKKIIKDRKTAKYGKDCYARVVDIQTTGTYVNNNPEYKALLEFFNPETNQLDNISEKIGFNPNIYPIDSYVLCKYYDGDINLLRIVNESEIPGDIQKLLSESKVEVQNQNIEMSSDGEYVTIDGVQYKKTQ